MTEAERLLWEKIRGEQLKGYQFYRQKTISNYMGIFVILKISPIPSFPKRGIEDRHFPERGLRISTGKSEEPVF